MSFNSTKMKHSFWGIVTTIALLLSTPAFAQRVWVEGIDGGGTTADDSVKVYFDKESSSFWTNGPNGIFMHAGVVLTSPTGTDWNYTNGDWNDLTAARQFTQEGDYWVKSFTPRTYFGVPDGTDVYRIQLLFRNEYDTDQANNKEDNGGSNFYIDLSVPDAGEVVSFSPNTLSDEDSITITFDASLGSTNALIDANKVYFHAAAITSSATSTSWEYAKGNWGNDDGVGLMTEIADDIWEFTFDPRTYFGVTDMNEDIFRLTYVFRNEDGSAQEKNSDADFIQDIEPGFYLSITTPNNNPTLVQQGNNVTISANSPSAADYEIYYNDTLVHSETGVTSVSYDQLVSTLSSNTISVQASTGGETKTKTAAVSGYSAIEIADLPDTTLQYGINYDPNDLTKATLLLHLPTQTKNVVHVIGDFNNWEISESYKMKKTTAGDVWWLDITGLTSGEEYIFQYLIDGNVRVADPYTHKVSDPWNDQYITSAVYPNLKAYPSAETENIAAYLQTNQPEYTWEVTDFTPVSHHKLNIYELHIRDFTTEGTYLSVIDKLDYIQNLGINCIHLMPVSEFEGNDSWGYNPNFYFAADKAYGTTNDLKKLVDECHKRGIAVINDMVLNHAFNTNAMARMYWDDVNNRPAADNPWFNAQHNMIDNTNSHWGSDFNHSSTHTQEFIDRVTDFWMTEFKMDGFRLDFTKGFTSTIYYGENNWASDYDQSRIDNLLRISNNLWSNHPGAIVIMEHLANNDENKALADNGILHWSGVSIHNDFNTLVHGFDNVDLSAAYSKSASINFNYDNWISYMESHDEERLAYSAQQHAKDFIKNDFSELIKRLKLAATFNMLIPGPRMIWQFGELAYDVNIDYNGRTGRKPIKWEYYDDADRKSLYDHYAALLHLRNKFEVFHHLSSYELGSSNWVKHLNYQSGDTVVAVIANFASYKDGDAQNNTPASYDETMNFLSAGTYFDILNGQEVVVSSTLTIGAGEMRILSNYPLRLDQLEFNTRWTDTGWSNGAPNKLVKVSIESNSPISADFSCRNLEIVADKNLSINESVVLTVSEEITTEGGKLFGRGKIKLDTDVDTVAINGSLELGCILEVSTGTVLKTNNNLKMGDGGILLHSASEELVGNVSAVRAGAAEALAYNYWAVPFTDGKEVTNIGSLHRYIYDEPSSSWTNVPDSLFAGQAMICTGADSVELSGIPHADNISVPVTAAGVTPDYQGFNLIGNPFLAPIDYDAFIATNTNIEGGTLYFYQGNSNGSGTYATINNINATEIPSFQGFFIKVATAGSIAFLHDHKSNADNTGFFRKKVEAFDHLTVTLKAGQEYTDQLDIVLGNEFTLENDFGYDALKLKGDQPLTISALVNEKTQSVVALPNLESFTIPLELTLQEKAKLSLNITQLVDSYTVSLENITTGEGIPLANEEFIEVYADHSYSLKLTRMQTILSSKTSSESLKPILSAKGFEIPVMANETTEVAVYTMEGKQLLKHTHSSNTQLNWKGKWDLPKERLYLIRISRKGSNNSRSNKVTKVWFTK